MPLGIELVKHSPSTYYGQATFKMGWKTQQGYRLSSAADTGKHKITLAPTIRRKYGGKQWRAGIVAPWSLGIQAPALYSTCLEHDFHLHGYLMT